MDTITYIRVSMQQLRDFMSGTIADLDDETWYASMPGALNTIAGTYAHSVTGEDGFVNGLLRGGLPLFASTWDGRTGLSELPPTGPGWKEWGSRLRIDRASFDRYASAVSEETDAYVSELKEADLNRIVDLSELGFGARPLGWVLAAGLAGHAYSHWGEICALVGVRGRRGYPV